MMRRTTVFAVLISSLATAGLSRDVQEAFSGRFNISGHRIEGSPVVARTPTAATTAEALAEFKTIDDWRKQFADSQSEKFRHEAAIAIWHVATERRKNVERLSDEETSKCRDAAKDLVKDVDDKNRICGLRALVGVGDDSTKTIAIGSIKDKHPTVAFEAARLVAIRYCDSSTEQVITQYVLANENPVKSHVMGGAESIAEQLGKSKSSSATKCLKAIAERADRKLLREAANRALDKRGDTATQDRQG